MLHTESISSNASNNETLLLDSLLDDIYNHNGSLIGDGGGQNTTNESDSNTLTTSSAFDATTFADRPCYSINSLALKGVEELREIRNRFSADVNQVSSKLVRLLKQRDITNRKVEKLANILTAVLQATSAKTAADAKLSFSLVASPGESGWQKWVDAMRAISRLPGGIPDHFRRKLWVGLADNYLASNRIDWNAVVRTAFNDKSNPDDSALGLQIVKDLHRTGCSNSFLPENADVDAERTLLKRVLLAYARWNKQVGYCQGFNVLATVILDTVDRNESDALKVMIYLIDHVLPANYYSNCLRLLAVDLAVFRHLLAANLPQLAQHLDKLQRKATSADDGIFYEPPVTNVFLMQWLLTLYATCLPKHALLRFWDCLLLNGSDALLSAGLHIFTKLSKHIMACSTVDQYYTSMEKNVKTILRESKAGSVTEADAFIQAVYKQLTPSVGELREQLLYSIQPFMAPTSMSSSNGGTSSLTNQVLDQKDSLSGASIFGCLSVCGRSLQRENNGGTFNHNNNEAYINGLTDEQLREIGAVRERMTTDLKKLKRNYDRLAKKRLSAVVVVPSAVDSGYETSVDSTISSGAGDRSKLGRSLSVNSSAPSHNNQPCFVTQNLGVMNHLLVSKAGLEEVNQRVVAVSFLEMVLPPNHQTSPVSPNPPSPAYPRRHFGTCMRATSTANKYPTTPQAKENDTGISLSLNETEQNFSAITLHGLTLDSLASEEQKLPLPRPVLSSLPASPELGQNKPPNDRINDTFTTARPGAVNNGSELVEIDITSDCDYPAYSYGAEDDDPMTPTSLSNQNQYNNSVFSEDSENNQSDSLLCKTSDSAVKQPTSSSSYFDKFSTSLSGGGGQERHALTTSYSAYYEASRAHQHQQSAKSSAALATHSPFPISTAARLKQRLHLIPGVSPKGVTIAK